MKSPFLHPRRLAMLFTVCLFCFAATSARAQLASQLYADAIAAYKAGNVADARHKLELTLEVDKNFRPASQMLKQINLVEQQEKASGSTGALPLSTKMLEQTVFPVEFKDTSLQTALEFIRQQTEEKSGGKAQINFVLQLPPELANKKVTLHLAHVPVTEMLHYLGDLAGVSFQMQRYAIAVVPATASAPAATDAPAGGNAAAAPTP